MVPCSELNHVLELSATGYTQCTLFRITAGSFNPEVFKSDRSLQSEELKKLLATAVTKKKNKKKKKVCHIFLFLYS